MTKISMSLLERAKAVKISRKKGKYSEEDYELVKAWLSGDVSLKQVAEVTGKRGANTYVYIATVAKELVMANNQ